MGREGREKTEAGGGKFTGIWSVVCQVLYFTLFSIQKREYLGLSECVVTAA